ncbi:MAG TPA: DUF1810 domain-containing protein [Allosphingosinicella sp.]
MTATVPDSGLSRFVEAQRSIYPAALAELRAGRKTSHWMWFVFPQIAGLGMSATAIFYAIASEDEARAYLAHPVLGPRLRECTNAVLDHRDKSAEAIFGPVDAMKLRSSMTLFERVGAAREPFGACLEALFDGRRDAKTLDLLGA